MATRPSRLERITNLVLVLLSAPRPLSLREIGTSVAGYPAEHGALRQAFERDKKTLRDGGIPISAEPIEGQDQYGYRIIPEQYYLPDLGLSASEEAELAFAIAAVRLEGGLGEEAAAKLGLTEPRGQRPIAALPALPALGVLHDAVRTRSRVRFAYHGREREVDPYGLVFRAGSWYLVGHDHSAAEGGGRRTFRVDRLQSAPVSGPPGAFVPPPVDLAAELRFAPIADGAAHAARVVIEVDARQAANVTGALGASSLELRRHDGSVRLACHVADDAAFVRWLLGFGDAVEVVAPEEMRLAVIAALEAAAAEPAAPPAAPLAAEPAPTSEPASATDPAAAGVQPGAVAAVPGAASNLDAGARLRRLLAVLAHLARAGEAPLGELAERFGMSATALVAELELAACCGLPPYTPDALLELVVDDDRVHAFALSGLERPPRLTPEEGFAVAAAARGLLAVHGTAAGTPLASALAKLEQALGSARLEVEIEHPPALEALSRAAAAGEMVDITYPDRSGALSARRVEPVAVVVREGRWYLDAFCHGAGEWRRFLVERVRSVRSTGVHGEIRTPPAAFGGARAFVGGPGTRRAVVEVPEDARAALDRVAAGPVRTGGAGSVLVAVDVADEAWLGRLLLGVPGARVLEPAELSGAVARAAAAALRRYRRSSAAGRRPPTRRRAAGG